MADIADAPASAATPSVRPTKPDEALYQENLAKAEKEHAQVLALFVRHLSIPSIPSPTLPRPEHVPSLEPTLHIRSGMRDLGPGDPELVMQLTSRRKPSSRRSTLLRPTRTRTTPPSSARTSFWTRRRQSLRNRATARTPVVPSWTKSSVLMSRSSPGRKSSQKSRSR
jgi:hypothetical protein